MMNFVTYLQENLISAKDFSDDKLLHEQLITESNELIFPKNNQHGKCRIYIGQHGKDRMQERHVSEKEVLDAILGGYKDISQAFKDGIISQSRDGKDSRFIVVDARKDKNNPVNVSAFIARSYKPNKLEHPSIIVRTVFKGDDFSGTTRNKKEEHKIFLY